MKYLGKMLLIEIYKTLLAVIYVKGFAMIERMTGKFFSRVWSMVLVCVLCAGCNLFNGKDAQKFTEVELHGLKFRFPSNYFRIPYENQYAHTTNLGIPVSELSILPEDPKIGLPRVDLSLSSESIEIRKLRAIDNYKTTQRELELENGMVVLVDPNRKNSFWAEDIVFPLTNGKIYFKCARPWINRLGFAQDVLCIAVTDLVPTMPMPKIRLEYTIQRKDLYRWTEIDAKVRTFIDRYAE